MDKENKLRPPLRTSALTLVRRTHVKYKCLMDEHDFSLRKHATAMIFAFGRGYNGIFFHHCVKKLAEIVCNTNKSVILSSVSLREFNNQEITLL